MTVTASASPSLALIKYWGKLPEGVNLPASSSLAVTLEGLRTVTRVTAKSEASGGSEDVVEVEGIHRSLEPYRALLDHFRERAGRTDRVRVVSTNSFPTSAGIASSSSGFAALALALNAFYGTGLPPSDLSAVARLGSGSAARAVYGGFTVWTAGSDRAEPVLPPDHWPELRIVVAVLDTAPKPISSRAGMTRSRDTSPVYSTWLAESDRLFREGTRALEQRDIEALGEAMRASYLLMFSTMLTATPPFIYWLPASVAILREVEAMRADGIPAWETMDAGPQVKIVTTDDHVDRVRGRLLAAVPDASIIVARPGGEPEVVSSES
ncbi:MAG: diphosphomevalonate decarboxylase [Spirochaetota bacterium]